MIDTQEGPPRRAEQSRTTKETDISISIDLDGPSHLEVSARGVHEPVRLELGTEQSPLTVELMRLVATVAGEGPDMSVTAEVAAA